MRFAQTAFVGACLAASTLAYSTESATQISRALHGIASGHELSRRDLADDLQQAQSTAMGLAQAAGEAVAGGGKCSSECSDWVGTMGTCVTASSVTESAQCVCGGSAITQMGSCGECLGGDNAQRASSLQNLCSEYASQLGGTSSAPGSESASASESTGSASSTASDAASSVSSAMSSVTSKASSSASSVPHSSGTSSSARTKPTSAPSNESGAGKATIGAAALFLTGAAAVLAA